MADPVANVPTDDAALFRAMEQVAYRTYKTPSVVVRGSHMQHTAITAGEWEWNVYNEDERRAFVGWANRLSFDPDATPENGSGKGGQSHG